MNLRNRIGAFLMNSLLLMPFLAVLATVFVISPELGNGLVSGKYFWFYGAMSTVAFVSAIVAFRSQKMPRLSWFDGLVLLYGAVALLSSSFINRSEVITRHILLLLVVMLYYYFRFVLQNNKQSRYWLSLGFILTGLVEAIWGLMQLYGFALSQHNLFSMTGSFFNPGPYACYVAMVAPAALHFVLRDRSCMQVQFRIQYWAIYLRWTVSALTVVASVIALPAAMSRAAWLAFLGGCGAILYSMIQKSAFNIQYMKFKNVDSKIVMGAVLVAVLMAGCAGMYYLKKDSADGRAFIWKNTFELVCRHPQGVGIGHFSGAYGDMQAAYFDAGRGSDSERYVAGNPEYAFNEYLQIAAEQGVLSLILFLCIIIAALRKGFKCKRTASVVSLLALLIAASASYPFSVLPFLIALAFLLAESQDAKVIPVDTKIYLTIGRLAALAALCVVAGCLCNRYPIYDAHKKWKRAEWLYQTGASADALAEYTPLYSHLSDQIKFLFEYAQCLSKTGRSEESNEVLQRAMRISCDPMLYNVMGKNYQALKQYAEAEQCFRKSANLIPSRIYPYYLLALMYKEAGEMEKAKAMAQTALAKEPKVQSTAVREIKAEMKKLLDSIP